MLIGVLGLVWLAVLGPPLLRSRSAHRRDNDFSAFYSSLSQLRPQHAAGYSASRTGGPVRSPESARHARQRTAARRRRVYGTLFGVMAATFVLGSLGSSRPMWMLFSLATVLLVAYTAILVKMEHTGLAVVTTIEPANIAFLPVRVAAPEFALRRTVNS